MNHTFSPAGPIVSAAELRRNFGEWQERAMLGPILVLRHGKPRLILCATDHYAQTAPEPAIDSALLAIPEHSSEGLLVLDRDLKILAVNRVFEDISGLSARQMLGQPWATTFPTAVDSIIGGRFRHVLRTGEATQFETPSVLVTGRHYVVTVFPHATGIAALIVNRTSEVEMREALEERDSLDASFALVPHVASVKINLRGFVRGASPQFRKITGYDPDNLSAPRFTEVMCESYRATVSDALERVLGGGQPARLAAAICTRDGETLPIGLSLAPLWRGSVADGAMAYFSVRDAEGGA